MSAIREHPFEYLCANGHSAGSPKELRACPAYRLGKPCGGALRRIGRGSRTPAKQKVTHPDL